MFMQELWATRLDWDEEVPESFRSRWVDFIQQFEDVSAIAIPRWFGTSSAALNLELHGFSDASQNALAAVIYLRVVIPMGIRVTLISAKTKVTPLKRVTIPRLELSAAVLLAKQLLKVREVLDLHNTLAQLWTDSTVALSWINSHPSRWKEFVRNRVSYIQELSNSSWHYISGHENSADVASRGASPQRLQRDALWWSGPQWLHKPSNAWPTSTFTINSTTHLEERARTCAVTIVSPEPEMWNLVKRYSSLTKLIRITAWMLRAVGRFRHSTNTPPSPNPLTPAELESSLGLWVRLTQQAYFPVEIHLLQASRTLPKSSSLFRLIPFLDPDNFLRLRGRLHFAQLDPAEKHPLILPRTSQLTELVIDHYHRRTFHGGPQLTISSIRRKFWILGGRLPIRSLM